MCYYGNPGVFQVQPMRNLSIGYYKYMSNPGGILLHRSQGISQLVIVLKPAAWDILVSAKLYKNQSQDELPMTRITIS